MNITDAVRTSKLSTKSLINSSKKYTSIVTEGDYVTGLLRNDGIVVMLPSPIHIASTPSDFSEYREIKIGDEYILLHNSITNPVLKREMLKIQKSL